MNSHVSCGIKSFLREKKLAACLDALVDKGFKEVIVVDDGPISTAKREVYQTYEKSLPLTLIEPPFDTGISAGRNLLIDHCTTPYILVLDDDQIVPDNIRDLYTIMEHDKSLGGIAGFWNEYDKPRCGATNLYYSGNYIVKDIRKPSARLTCGLLSYFLYDFIPNSTLFRLACLQDIRWDPFYKIGSEHLDFYLAHKKLGRWKFAVTPDVVIRHDPREPETEYRDDFRKNDTRLNTSFNYLKSKWGIVDVIENRKHINDPWVSHIKQSLISQFIRFGIKPDKALRWGKRLSAWIGVLTN